MKKMDTAKKPAPRALPDTTLESVIGRGVLLADRTGEPDGGQ
ncbi:MAG TPA: hypothetical protein VN783_15005 [Thermoanaerobaculia bacterium]|nr:hypothetical protein [Thermoanaerobaculia bacterium]